MNKATIAYILMTLNDPDGINIDAYDALANLSGFFPDTLTPIMDQVEATNNRFYLDEDAANVLAITYGVLV